MESLINTSKRLLPLLDEVRVAPWLAVDTEADSLHSYPEKLCLVQVSLPGRDELIDPLAPGLELGPLWEAAQGHRLILHGADYDLRLLQRAYRFTPKAVFDTMLAGRLLGLAELGLDKLVARYLGVRLEKASQRANWSKRPLTARMIEYARNDTRHLKPLADSLGRQLDELGRTSWHEEMCDRLIREVAQARPADPDDVWRLGGSDRLDRRGLAVLREVWRWRDGEALHTGRPPFFILPHATLVAVADAVARGQPTQGLLPRHLSPARRHGVEHAVQRALEQPESQWPRPRRRSGLRLSMAQRGEYAALEQRRNREAKALALDPSLVASRSVLVGLASGQLDPAKDLMAWQRRLLFEG